MASGEQIEQLLRDLGRAFSEVMSTSQEVVVAVQRLRQQGYDLSLGVDHAKSPQLNARVALSVLERKNAAAAAEKASAALPAPAPVAPAAYRLEAGDVALLRSLGIDATRQGKRKR